MKQFQEDGELIRREQLAPGIWRLGIRAPEIAMAARPGQFVMVETSCGRDPLLRRPLSIHQSTADGTLLLLFKVVGKGTEQLAEIPIGRRINLVGPLGRGFDLGTAEGLCLVGGGMGIAPLFFLCREALRSGRRTDPVVMLGARNRSELSHLAEDFGKLGVKRLHLATDDGSLGHHGLVGELLSTHLEQDRPWTICTCGPSPMMRVVAAYCRAKGWPCQVSLETMMACGIGACLGCAVPSADTDGDYIHVCKDGPVFDPERLGWWS